MSDSPQIASLLDEDELALQDAVRRFMKQEVEPLSEQMERDGQPPRALFRKLGQMGYLGSFLPEEYGGGGASIATRAIISEETARVNAGLDISLFADIILFARALATYGTHEQKLKYLAPVLAGEKIGSMAITETKGGSNALGARTTARAVGGDYVINGSKTFITNAPIADFILVLTRTSGAEREVAGGTWFIVERGTPGLATGKPFEKLGMRSSPTSEVFLQDVRVGAGQVLGEVGQGFHYLLRALDVERVLEGASTVGIAQACLDVAARYALEREVFGKQIAQYQLIQEKIAAMESGIELSRTLLYRLLRAVDRGEKVTREAAVLKLYSSQMALQAASDAVQILGGHGYVEDNKVARFFRDAKHHEIGAGTSEIMKVIISREALRRHG
ncbi:MAG: acyl-CoA dehydrogenase family protein [Burkholderiaceae bacterium]|jgi:alkylation response protein AidB-like acyl-CoA dehydrogenase|nr:acyl-CoA dehydrogenase family protein [Burkholderiaceae bacterium]